jgi:hypothetical protein
VPAGASGSARVARMIAPGSNARFFVEFGVPATTGTSCDSCTCRPYRSVGDEAGRHVVAAPSLKAKNDCSEESASSAAESFVEMTRWRLPRGILLSVNFLFTARSDAADRSVPDAAERAREGAVQGEQVGLHLLRDRGTAACMYRCMAIGFA